jgi:hypothetical protein
MGELHSTFYGPTVAAALEAAETDSRSSSGLMVATRSCLYVLPNVVNRVRLAPGLTS